MAALPQYLDFIPVVGSVQLTMHLEPYISDIHASCERRPTDESKTECEMTERFTICKQKSTMQTICCLLLSAISTQFVNSVQKALYNGSSATISRLYSTLRLGAAICASRSLGFRHPCLMRKTSDKGKENGMRDDRRIHNLQKNVMHPNHSAATMHPDSYRSQACRSLHQL